MVFRKEKSNFLQIKEDTKLFNYNDFKEKIYL
jgi:hypothetical protein